MLGCAAPTGSTSAKTKPTTQPEPKVVAVGCPDAAHWATMNWQSEDLGPIPASFRPTAVVMCTDETRTVARDGTWAFLVEQRADSGFSTFVDELRRPSDELSSGPCPGLLIIAPWFELIGPDGQGLRVAVPRDECSQPRESALNALRGLPFKTVKETRLGQVESQAAIDAGCAMRWKNMPAIEVGDGMARSSARDRVFPTTPNQLTLCRFSADPRDVTAGHFVSGKKLTGATIASVLAELEASQPASACTLTSSTFAVLTPNPAGATVYVELDGCHRILTDAHELRQASPALIALLS
jgi:hypothetical protein